MSKSTIYSDLLGTQAYLERSHGFEERKKVIYDKIAGLQLWKRC